MHAENGGVADVSLQVFVERDFHALLAGFNVIGFSYAGAPVVISIVADEIGDRSARNGGGEKIRRVVAR